MHLCGNEGMGRYRLESCRFESKSKVNKNGGKGYNLVKNKHNSYQILMIIYIYII